MTCNQKCYYCGMPCDMPSKAHKDTARHHRHYHQDKKEYHSFSYIDGKITGSKLILGLLLLFMLVPFISAKSLSTTTTSLATEYTIGGQQPASIPIIVKNNDNDTFSVFTSKNGNVALNFNLDAGTLLFQGNTSATVNILFNVSSPEGVYSGNIVIDTLSIPIFLVVKPNPSAPTGSQNNCTITAGFPEFVTSIKKSIKPSTNDFNFNVDSSCVGGVIVNDIKSVGTILLDSGYEPIRLVGGIPKGFHSAGSSFTISIEYDVTDLETGTYTPAVLVTGQNGGKSVGAQMKFLVTVVGQASPVPQGTSISPPTFDSIPSPMSANQSYALTANNVNPNVKMKVEVTPSDIIYGETTETSGTSWIWKFHPVKTGTVKIKAYGEYNGGIIGIPLEREINIVASGVQTGTTLDFKFFPEISTLKSGDNLTILLLDHNTQSIIPNFDLYINGVKSLNIVFIEGGKNYSIIGSAPSYLSKEYTFIISPKTVTLSLSSGEIKISETLFITTDPSDAVVTLDGVTLENKTYSTDKLGDYTLKASKTGYFDAIATFKVINPLIVVKEPELLNQDEDLYNELVSGQAFAMEFNKVASWVVYKTGEDNKEELVQSGEGTTLSFTPSGKGTYRIEADGTTIRTYEIEGAKWLKWFDFAWYWWVIVPVGIFVLLKIRGGKKRSKSFGYPDSQSTVDRVTSEVNVR